MKINLITSILFLSLFLPSTLVFAEVESVCITTYTNSGAGTYPQRSCWFVWENTRKEFYSFERFIRGRIELGSISRNPNIEDAEIEFEDLSEFEKCLLLNNSNPASCILGVINDVSPNGCSGGAPQSFSIGGGTSANFAQDACNPHDVCYNQIGVSKLRCDSEFYGNLLASCEDAFGSFQTYDRNGVPIVNYRAALCKAVADTMKAGIDFPIVSELFFTNAQNNNMCNIWNEAMEENNCSV
ncbi:hypothetical protein [Planctobacterium marinum]|uniref:Phospholipase A2 n=1 Tax=Planctobacterium marinum TaxID=1631968 RepID=A0AA48I9G3_9ALTE|nr:hypothetical protein MACH26_39210 [Planctobacterium marinum]